MSLRTLLAAVLLLASGGSDALPSGGAVAPMRSGKGAAAAAAAAAFVPSRSRVGGAVVGARGAARRPDPTARRVRPRLGSAEGPVGAELDGGRRRRRVATPSADGAGGGAELRGEREEEEEEDAAVSERRRDALRTLSSALPPVLLLLLPVASNPSSAEALPLLGGGGGAEGRRQLELCLVNVLRVKYWAVAVSESIAERVRSAPPGGGGASDGAGAPYLEARLGAKALLTGRVGGGANARVYGLSSLQIKGCLADAEAWYADSVRAAKKGRGGGRDKVEDRRRDLGAYGESIVESLGACVEFDGLETTQDPSPRSSLMLSMYTADKATFVRRTLAERTAPACRDFVDVFGAEVRGRCERYVRETYPGEVPRPPAQAPALAAEGEGKLSSLD